MEVSLTETVYSLIGVTPILDFISEEVIAPFHHHKYGSPSSQVQQNPPKLILISGETSSGKKSVSSAIVNELRRGNSRKRGDIFYKNRDVKYCTWDNNINFDEASNYIRQQFAAAKDSTRDLTVFHVQGFNSWFSTKERRKHLATFLEELDGIPVGKLLIIGSTIHPSEIHAEIKSRVQFHYHLLYPSEQARADFIMTYLEEQRAKLHYDIAVEYLVSKTKKKFPFGILKAVMANAVRSARFRNHDSQTALSEVTVEKRDFELLHELIMFNESSGARVGNRGTDGDRQQPPPDVGAAAPPPQPIPDLLVPTDRFNLHFRNGQANAQIHAGIVNEVVRVLNGLEAELRQQIPGFQFPNNVDVEVIGDRNFAIVLPPNGHGHQEIGNGDANEDNPEGENDGPENPDDNDDDLGNEADDDDDMGDEAEEDELPEL